MALEARKKNPQLHIKCAQAFHGLSNPGVICDARKTHCLMSWVTCAHVDDTVCECSCMCTWSGHTPEHTAAVKPAII